MQDYNTLKDPCQVLSITSVVNEHTQSKKADYLADAERRKILSLALSDAYDLIGKEKKSDTVFHCSNFITIGSNKNRKFTTLKAFRCKDRLCSECQKILSNKKYALLCGALDESEKSGKYQYIFLTLTIKNVGGSSLKTTLNNLLKAFNRFVKMRKFTNSIHGWYRSLEITHNKDTNEYHPHIHVLLQVTDEYFKKKSKLYITQNTFVKMWRNALERQGMYVPDACIIDIRKVYADTVKNELTKYIVKSMDIIDRENPKQSAERVTVVSDAIRGVRFSACGGNIKKVKITDDYEINRIAEYTQNIEAVKFNHGNFKYETYKKDCS